MNAYPLFHVQFQILCPGHLTKHFAYITFTSHSDNSQRLHFTDEETVGLEAK